MKFTTRGNDFYRLLFRLCVTKDLLCNSKTPRYHNKSPRNDAWNEIAISDLNIMASFKKEILPCKVKEELRLNTDFQIELQH